MMKFVWEHRADTTLDQWLSREYLQTNGAGGFAMNTLADCPTRKYHGLLALPDEKSGRTCLFLSKIELSILAGPHQYDLSTNLFPNAVFPDGFRHIASVEIDGGPVTRYSVNDGEYVLRKSLCLPRGEPCVLVRYELLEAGKPITLKLMPFLAYRDIHALVRQNPDLRPRTYFEANGFKVDPYPDLPPLFVQTSKTSMFYPSPEWWNNFQYPAERDRGYEYAEDLFSPGVFEVKLKAGEAVTVRAALAACRPPAIDTAWQREIERRRSRAAVWAGDPEPLAVLKAAADHYLTDAPSGILAGFPWFAVEWGRDAFISLPGLLLCRGLYREALALLKRFSILEKNGLLPNTVSRTGRHAYNSLDTTFLYCRAAQRYLSASGDRAGVEKDLLPAMERMLAALGHGRTPGAAVGKDGLLYGGSDHTQLTWMDAQVHGKPVTSRHGAAVEINALYYNALAFLLDDFGGVLEPANASLFRDLRLRFEKNFETRFWNEETACLYDVIRGPDDRDGSIRPNQLFAIGLPSSAVSPERARLTLETVKTHLVTPFGLRTLSPGDPAYVPDYRGDQDARDRAYHQGAVWPWLIGIYFDAALKHAADPVALKRTVRRMFSPLWEAHLADACVPHVSELFSAAEAHRPEGSPAQAWSLAEVLRVLIETAEPE